VNLDGFEAAMAKQKAMARDASNFSSDKAGGAEWLALKERLGATEFLGYDASEVTGKTLAIVKDGAEVEDAEAGDTVQVLFDRTPFYAESGGQASDVSGQVEWDGGAAELITLSKEAGDLFAHALRITDGVLKPGQPVRLELDLERRAKTRANHSAAHLVHAALKNVLGDHVAQKGQMVDAERMRFDFSHGGPLTPEELDRVEAEVNAVIRQNLPAETKNMTPDEAIAEGAVALFGEKYGDSVRVLTLGRALVGKGAYSVELCGGTHVARTGDIALFKIVAETGIASGIRRVEALTGEAARRYLLDQAGVAKGLAEEFKVPVAEVPARVESLIADRKRLERDLADAKKKLALGGSGGAAPAVEDIGGVKFIGRVLDGVDGKALRPIIEEMKKQADVVAVVGVNGGKAAVAGASAIPDRFSSADLVKAAVIAMGGQGGGGRPDFAQGGAPDASKAEDGVAAVRAALS
jgi:alanyl-tRNA synthetase